MSLGRGLESLIPQQNQPDNHQDPADISGPEYLPAERQNSVNSANQPSAVFHIEVDKIEPNPQQPRRNFDEAALRELASSIREFGVIHPIVVTKIEKETEGGSDVSYQLVAGERRWLASKIAGLERIPAVVRSIPTDREKLELAIIENLQREDLNPIEAARAFSRLQDEFNLTQREIAARIGKSRESVANAVRLLNLPSHIQESVEQNRINESQARLLLAVSDLASQERLFKELLRNNLSVRELRSEIKKNKNKTNGQTADDLGEEYDPELIDIKEQLEAFFGAPVSLQKSGASGKIVITFYSPEELRNIISRLASGNGLDNPNDPEPTEESDDFVV